MKRLIIMAVLAGFVFSAAAQTKTRTLTLPDFIGVDISSYFDVEISKGNREDVEITYSPELEPYIIAKVLNGKILHLGIDTKDMPRDLKRENSRGRYILKAKIVTPDIESLETSGAAKVELNGDFTPRIFKGDFSGASSIKGLNIRTKSASIDCSGASKLQIFGSVSDKASYDFSGASHADIRQDIGDLYIETSGASKASIEGALSKIKIDLSGASSMSISGKSEDMNLRISGASHFNGDKFDVNSASVNASGASSASVDVSRTLQVNISGSSSVKYSDSRNLDVQVKNISKGASLIKR